MSWTISALTVPTLTSLSAISEDQIRVNRIKRYFVLCTCIFPWQWVIREIIQAFKYMNYFNTFKKRSLLRITPMRVTQTKRPPQLLDKVMATNATWLHCKGVTLQGSMETLMGIDTWRASDGKFLELKIQFGPFSVYPKFQTPFKTITELRS